MLTTFGPEIHPEEEMERLGTDRVQKLVHAAREAGEETKTPYGKKILKVALDGYATALKTLMEKKGSGPRHRAIGYFKGLDPHVLAFIVMQGVIDGMALKKKYTNLAVSVGRRIDDELRFNAFAGKNKALWETLRKDLKRRENNMQRRRGILKHEMNKAAQLQADLKWASMQHDEQLLVGSCAIDLLVSGTDLFKRVLVGRGKKSFYALAYTPDTAAFIKELVDERSGIMAPMLLPITEPPLPWINPFVGGYQTIQHANDKRVSLVKTYGPRGNNYLEELANLVDAMPMVYRSINAVQATPWKINKAVANVMTQAWKTGLEIGDVTSGVEIPLPPKPHDIKTNEESLTTWKRAAAKVYTRNAQQTSRRLQLDKLMWLADKFRDAETLYFPMQLDFRGRMYALPSFLNPQGNDPAKALITFARGKRLGADGWKWLHIHTANVWGADKISFDDREEWARTNYAWYRKCAMEPFKHREWMDADKPWQFLAAAMEMVAAVESGDYEGHVSSLPVSVDGTCNGLQHFSAMLLDEQGAEAVNLTPNELPQDIYQRVADRVKVRIQEDVHDGTLSPETRLLAQEWITWGFDRKAVKRAVMIVPYSGTLYAAKDYTREYIEKTAGCPWEDMWEPSIYFAKHVWAAISETVTSAREAMNWLRKTSSVVSAHGAPMIWTTPVGFPVVQDYREMTSYRVDTRLGDGTRYQPRLDRETEALDKRGQEQGISPNFVHSLDAACLMLTVCRAQEEGIENFAMVHDSYGVVAADMETLYTGLRQAFVDIYANDVMGDFLRSTTSSLNEEERKKLPAMPPKGSFVLEQVKQSQYFFA